MIVFASNYMNHHQLPFCLNLKKLLNDEFFFIASEPIPAQRLQLGYQDLNDLDFVIKTYCSKEEAQKADQLCREADVMIIGSAPERYISIRDRNKIIFRYSERPYKNYSKIKSFISEILHHYRFLTHDKIYILSASAYTAIDHAQFGMYKNKMFKWGYFPEVKTYDTQMFQDLKKKENIIIILWTGRFISWKHPEVALEIAKKLKNDNICFKLKMIGSGKMESKLMGYAIENNLLDCVEFTGSMSPQQVRTEMEMADIFMFTSDRNEGWGAVLDEAMNSGCAVVASHAIGSVPFLIENGENGLIYKNEDVDDLYQKVKMLMLDRDLREKMGRSAYITMTEMWNPCVAAKRFLLLAKEIEKNGNCDLFEKGPCSKAKILKNNWM